MVFLPKSDDLYWTQHSLRKLRQYNLSVSRIKRILRYPNRKEVGVAPDTVACMQPAGSKKRPHEIWVMYQQKVQSSKFKVKSPGKIKIISAWRYPGISPVHEPPPIPEEVWKILTKHKKT
ncbi:MAG: hypothetical protein A2Y98_02635 [Candidatus Portnoybacteria bacterium RBG_19FT_COMBO_36_7]|uniref:Uncharacterized protein n=1 Tax=Candidatus Portnoybacteria bacterium RBG_19FT_COMBO_36_7 TaxID=1801992 RepID=A0A1G2F7A5_9BACT|nr:MAG: hypothetical protein A2Y98_02635 [Candidatus Portnoybacteria bacterium RBG_19FT_COMBO_36_7]